MAAPMFRSILFALSLGPISGAASAADPTALRINTFPTARSLPFYVGVEKGIFAKHGLAIDLEFTENSQSQRDGLAAGKFQIVHSAVDNALAMIDVAGKDVVIISGGDSGTNEFYVQSYVNSFADVRGHTLVVDAANTAYALQAKKLLARSGLKDSADYKVKEVGNGSLRLKAMMQDKENAAAILNLPFTVQAEAAGMKSLGRTTDLLGPYQAGGAFVMRDWARSNASVLERYIAAYVESLRWSLAPANRAAAVAMLVEKLKLAPALAERTYTLVAEPGFGFSTDAKFSMEGFRNALALRAEIEAKGSAPPPPERYIDLGYYENAMKLLDAR
jgi:ABC-type nitrate/sulfonate/bicarbonate transport system substrate-binding protein